MLARVAYGCAYLTYTYTHKHKETHALVGPQIISVPFRFRHCHFVLAVPAKNGTGSRRSPASVGHRARDNIPESVHTLTHIHTGAYARTDNAPIAARCTGGCFNFLNKPNRNETNEIDRAPVSVHGKKGPEQKKKQNSNEDVTNIRNRRTLHTTHTQTTERTAKCNSRAFSLAIDSGCARTAAADADSIPVLCCYLAAADDRTRPPSATTSVSLMLHVCPFARCSGGSRWKTMMMPPGPALPGPALPLPRRRCCCVCVRVYMRVCVCKHACVCRVYSPYRTKTPRLRLRLCW